MINSKFRITEYHLEQYYALNDKMELYDEDIFQILLLYKEFLNDTISLCIACYSEEELQRMMDEIMNFFKIHEENTLKNIENDDNK